MHPDMDSDVEEEWEDDEGVKHTRKVIDFNKEATHGHMFTIYQDRKNRTPHERFVKINYSKGKPTEISWGSGNRCMKWDNVKFVIKGRKSRTMQVWKDVIDEDHTWTVVGKDGTTFDCSASDDHSRDIWANGITKLLGMTEEERQKLQDEYDPGEIIDTSMDVIKKDKTASQLETQQKLFFLLVEVTFRDINFEGVYGIIGDEIKSIFMEKKFYQKALDEKVPWRTWDTWIRAEVIAYLLGQTRTTESGLDVESLLDILRKCYSEVDMVDKKLEK